MVLPESLWEQAAAPVWLSSVISRHSSLTTCSLVKDLLLQSRFLPSAEALPGGTQHSGHAGYSFAHSLPHFCIAITQSTAASKSKIMSNYKTFLTLSKKNSFKASFQWTIKHGVRPLTGNVLLYYLLQSAVTGDTFNQLPYNYAKAFTKYKSQLAGPEPCPSKQE